jgi:hypothetical protein
METFDAAKKLAHALPISTAQKGVIGHDDWTGVRLMA